MLIKMPPPSPLHPPLMLLKFSSNFRAKILVRNLQLLIDQCDRCQRAVNGSSRALQYRKRYLKNIKFLSLRKSHMYFLTQKSLLAEFLYIYLKNLNTRLTCMAALSHLLGLSKKDEAVSTT